MLMLLVALILICGGARALTWLIQGDRALADRYRPSTGDPVWDAFYETTVELPSYDEVFP
jgi:hypothetical protein